MVVTCSDADVCTYLENILGFRQTGDADIHADTKATADLVQDNTFGLVAIQGLAYNSSSNTDFIYGQEATFEALGITRNDYLQQILGIRQTGESDIHADTQDTEAIVASATFGNAAIKNTVNTVETHAAAIDTHLGGNVNGQASISDYLANILGTRQGGDADIHADTKAIASILQLAAHGGYPVTGLLSALGYPNGSVATPADDANRIIADFALLTALNTLIGTRLGDALGNLGNLFYALAITFIDATGVLKATEFAKVLTSLNAAPAFTDLQLTAAITIDPTAVYQRPDGAYGVQLFLDVPVDWGKIDENPNVYVPSVARVSFGSSIGTLPPPVPIDVAFPTFYPLNSAMSSMTISLGVGVLGTFSWLLLPH